MTALKSPVPLSVERIKRQAREVKIATGCSHCHALEQIARNHGYRTYAALLADVKTRTAS